MSYMSKKAHKRQTTIVTLSDQNQQEIQMIKEQKEHMLEDYEDKKKGELGRGHQTKCNTKKWNVT